VGPAGDVNNDGYDDVLSRSDQGVYLILGGPRNRFSSTANFTGLGTALITIYPGLTPSSVYSAGDVNNDGYDDILTTDGDHQVLLIYGRSSFPSYYNATFGAFTPSEACLIFSTNGEDLGYEAITGGDVNGDSFSDVFIGGSGYGASQQGRAVVIYGNSTLPSLINLDTELNLFTFINGSAPSEALGYGVAINDFNGDGVDDLFLNNDIGKSFLIYGRAPPSQTPVPSQTPAASQSHIVGSPSSAAPASSTPSGSGEIAPSQSKNAAASSTPAYQPLEGSNNPKNPTRTPKKQTKSHTPRPSPNPTEEAGATPIAWLLWWRLLSSLSLLLAIK